MKRATSITWEQLKVGGMILVALAILTVAVFKLGEAANLFSKRYKLVALLPSANGLRVGGSVTVAGQLAGTVSAIDFLAPDADTTRNLRVVVEIDQALQPFECGTRADAMLDGEHTGSGDEREEAIHLEIYAPVGVRLELAEKRQRRASAAGALGEQLDERMCATSDIVGM